MLIFCVRNLMLCPIYILTTSRLYQVFWAEPRHDEGRDHPWQLPVCSGAPGGRPGVGGSRGPRGLPGSVHDPRARPAVTSSRGSCRPLSPRDKQWIQTPLILFKKDGGTRMGWWMWPWVGIPSREQASGLLPWCQNAKALLSSASCWEKLKTVL